MKGRVLEDTTTDRALQESHLWHGRVERTESDELGLNRENNSNNMWVSSSGGGINGFNGKSLAGGVICMPVKGHLNISLISW